MWCNAIQEEIAEALEGFGIVLNSGVNNQLLGLLRSLSTPSGTIIAFAGTAAPSGYLACGTSPSTASRVSYPNLFAAIGTTWGVGDGSTTFGLPYFPVGYAAVQGGIVGTETVGQVISHLHSIDSAAANSGPGNINNGSGVTEGNPAITQTGSTGGSANFAAGSNVLMCVKT